MIDVACANCFAAFKARNAGEDICGYALYSDSGAMTVCPAVNIRSHLEAAAHQNPDDAAYCKWSPGEWSHEHEGVEFFEEISDLLRTETAKLENGEQFAKFRETLFETCVASLEKMKTKGLFSKDADYVLVFALSDTERLDDEIKWIRRLNSERKSCEFADWIQSTRP